MSKKYLDIPFSIKAEDITDEGTFQGWGSLFDQTPDAHRDLVARGAFLETLAKGGRNGTGIMMGWQHKVFDMPPGVWLELREDPRGLYVKGQLNLETQLGRDIHSMMKLGVKTGMWRFSLSIGYDSLEEEFTTVKVGDDNIRVRLLKKIDLWEISIVNFPAKLGATVTNVKQVDIEKLQDMTERELESYLRESGGCSKAAAQLIINWKKSSLRESERENALERKRVISPIEEAIRQVRKDFQTTILLNSLLGGLKDA